jgi:hypothetical protein
MGRGRAFIHRAGRAQPACLHLLFEELMRLHFVIASLVTITTFAACGDHAHSPEAYATFQLCYDDHHTEEALPVTEAIAVCCLEHPIAGVLEVCGATAATCQTYLGTNLGTASATPAEVTAGCDAYITQKGQ